jgi:transcriptional/translational regulatory protein YebC/TACO1
VILIEKTDAVDEDSLMETALDAGMEDMIEHDDSFEIRTSPEAFDGVADALRAAKYELADADVEYVPSVETAPSESDLKSLSKMIELLEDNDDVQKVYTNCASL